MRARIRQARLPEAAPGEPWAQGTDRDWLAGLLGYWAGEFGWPSAQRYLNGFAHYRARAGGTTVHLVHGRARHGGGIPLILTHGWPSCFAELLPLVPLLTDPGAHGIGGPAFDVVIPSLPGYGFSPRPAAAGPRAPRSPIARCLLPVPFRGECPFKPRYIRGQLIMERGCAPRATRYAEVVRWMAWLRIKKSRSSALPGAPSPDGAWLTVRPVPDADPDHGRGHNAGVSGTRHSVASEQPAFVHYADSGVDDVSADYDEAADVGGEAPPRDDGIAILEGVVTSRVPADDEADTGYLEVPEHRRNEQFADPPRPAAPARESKAAPSGGTPVSVTPPAWDNGQRRITVRDLPPDVRLRIWRWRAIIVIVVGVVFTILASWPVGLTLGILAGIIDTIYRSRAAPDIAAGGSQTAAQRSTRRQLHRMRRAGYLALDARPIPNSREVIDHLVIGPTGVYAIDSERWHKKVPIRTYNGKQLWHGPENKKPRLEHAKWEAQQASERLSAALGFQIAVRPAMAIYGPKVPWHIATIRDVDVFTGTDLGKYLRRRGRMRDVSRLTRDQVQTVFNAARTVLPDVAPTRTFTPVG